MTFHCPRCSKEWQVPDTVVSHWHLCTVAYTGDEPPRRRIPMASDQVGRGQFWRALLDAVPDEEMRRR